MKQLLTTMINMNYEGEKRFLISFGMTEKPTLRGNEVVVAIPLFAIGRCLNKIPLDNFI